LGLIFVPFFLYNQRAMKKSIVISLIMVVTFGFLLAALAAPVVAAPQAQLTPFPTPTPGPDGRIVYIVQTGDSLWRIAAVAGITIDELRSLNNLGVDAVISPGQQLLLGLGGPSAGLPTQGPPPTATSELPTPTPGMGTGTLCVLLFEDVNGDALRQEEELSLPGGAISVNDLTGAVNITAETPSGGISNALFPDPDELGFTCFEDLEKGEYNITVAIPDGYNPTTQLSHALVLNAGEETLIDFGAQPNSETLAEAPIPVGTGPSPLLGIVGGVLLLLGIGLGVFAFVLARRR
jgi:hypothetical protein